MTLTNDFRNTFTKTIRYIQKQLDKIPTSPGLIRPGNWRVQYSDGKLSRTSTYDVAGEYAEIFGGVVIWTRHEGESNDNNSL